MAYLRVDPSRQPSTSNVSSNLVIATEHANEIQSPQLMDIPATNLASGHDLADSTPACQWLDTATAAQMSAQDCTATERAAAMTPGEATTATRPTDDQLAVTSDETKILLCADDIPSLKAHGASGSHAEARELLQRLASTHNAQDNTGPLSLAAGQFNWAGWRRYLANHKQAKDIIGPGVVGFTSQFIEGTKDPNRGGQRRLDFVVHHVDGGCYRLHPGSKSRNDAKPVYVPPQSPLVCFQYLPLEGQTRSPFTTRDIGCVPQHDRLSMQEAWERLSAIRDATEHTQSWLDITSGDALPWWQWVPNLGKYTMQTIDPGIATVELRLENRYSPDIQVCLHRCDGSDYMLQVSKTAADRFKLNAWEITTPAHSSADDPN